MTAIAIGLGGRLRAGKDAVADHLVYAHGFKKLGMSDPLLEHMLILNPYIRVTLRESWGLRFRVLPGFWQAQRIHAKVGYVEAKTIAEWRRFMQVDGTDAGRHFFGENVWVNVLARKIDDHLYADQPVVVTGIRFPNELAMVRQFAGEGLWVDRPGLDSGTPASTHASETSISAEDFDRIITNDGTLEQLYATVNAFMERKRA